MPGTEELLNKAPIVPKRSFIQVGDHQAWRLMTKEIQQKLALVLNYRRSTKDGGTYVNPKKLAH